MTSAQAGFEPAQRGHICSSARRFNHAATGQGQYKSTYFRKHSINMTRSVLTLMSSILHNPDWFKI